MGRKAHANYIEAAVAVLEELGGGPVSTKTLVDAAQEKGLIGDGKWIYHNFSRKIRESNLFDTSVRGQVSLVGNFEPKTVEVEESTETVADEGFEEEMETEVQQFPNSTLGSGFAE